MSGAATEYYGYLLSKGYTGEQLDGFEEICEKVNKGKISMNQSFKQAKALGFSNQNGTEKAPSSLNEWIETAQQAGWIDKGLNALTAAIKNRGNKDQPQAVYIPPAPPEKPKTMQWVLLSVALVGVGVGIYYLATKKNN